MTQGLLVGKLLVGGLGVFWATQLEAVLRSDGSLFLCLAVMVLLGFGLVFLCSTILVGIILVLVGRLGVSQMQPSDNICRRRRRKAARGRAYRALNLLRPQPYIPQAPFCREAHRIPTMFSVRKALYDMT